MSADSEELLRRLTERLGDASGSNAGSGAIGSHGGVAAGSAGAAASQGDATVYNLNFNIEKYLASHSATSPDTQAILDADRMYHRARSLLLQNRRTEAIPAYRDLIERFAGFKIQEVQEFVSVAMINLAGCYKDLGRWDDSTAQFIDLYVRFTESPVAGLRRMGVAGAALAMENHRALGRPANVVQTFDTTLRRQEDDPDPIVRSVVERARVLRESAEKEVKRAGRKGLFGRLRR